MFCYVYFWVSGTERFYDWRAALGLGPGIAAVVAFIQTWAARILMRHGFACRKEMVTVFCLWFALGTAWWSGDQNYGHNMISYFTYQDLVAYVDLNPAVAKGQSYMDAGQVYFKEDTKVSTSDMVSFKSRTNFCAAPILGQPLRNQGGSDEVEVEGDFVIPKSGTVDFWAVGTDCCDQSSRTFNCGQVKNPRARAGMRMIREDYRPYYLLAVQEWTARMCPTSGEDNTAAGMAEAAPLRCLPARHPLFFTYVEDPVAEETEYFLQAIRDRHTHFAVFFAVNGLFTFLLLWVLRELGFK